MYISLPLLFLSYTHLQKHYCSIWNALINISGSYSKDRHSSEGERDEVGEKEKDRIELENII